MQQKNELKKYHEEINKRHEKYLKEKARQQSIARSIGAPVSLSEQFAVAIQQHGGLKSMFRTRPPIQFSYKDYCNESPEEHINLDGAASSDWLEIIVNRTFVKVNYRRKSVCKTLSLRDSKVTDLGFKSIAQLKALEVLDISRCSFLTDESLVLIRRYIRQLSVLKTSGCRNFSSKSFCELYRDCKQLRSLTTRGCSGMTDTVLQFIASHKRNLQDSNSSPLTYLDVSNCKYLTGAGILAICSSDQVHMLEYFAFGGCSQVKSMAFFGFGDPGALPNLVNLDISNLSIDEAATSWIAQVGTKSLQKLNLSDCISITDFCLSLLSNCKLLEELNLKGCYEITNKGIEQFLKFENEEKESAASFRETILKTIILKECANIGNEGLQLIGSYCPELKAIDLRGLSKVTDAGIIYLAKGCEYLKDFKISGCRTQRCYGQPKITNEGLKFFGRLCHGLKKLDLGGCKVIGNEGVKALSLACTELRTVDLNNTKTGDVALVALAANCKKLESLCVSKCKDITNIGINSISKGSVHLKSMFICSCPKVTEDGLISIADSGTPIEHLDLSGNEIVSDEILSYICENCPSLRSIGLKGCLLLTCNGVQESAKYLAFAYVSEKPFLTIQSFPSYYVNFVKQIVKQYQKVLVIQSQFSHWQQRQSTVASISRRKHGRESRAARVIQRKARQYIQWKGFIRLLSLGENMDKIIYVQACIRGYSERKKFRKLKHRKIWACRRIQRQYRQHFIQRIMKSIEIQRVFRGYLGRNIVKHMIYLKHVAVANEIKGWYKRCVQKFKIKERARNLVKCCTRIQRQFRIFRGRSHFRSRMKYYRQRIILIQSVIRMRLSIWFVKAKRITMNFSANEIQRIFRGYSERRYVQFFQTNCVEASMKIQRQFRSYACRKIYLRKRYLIIKTQEHEAKLRLARRVRKIAMENLRVLRFNSAVCIQRHIRGRRGRKRAILFWKIRNAKLCRKGQNAMQFLRRRRLLRLGAALRIQRWAQSLQMRNKTKKIFLWKRKHAALSIQKYCKAWHRRLIAERTKRNRRAGALDFQRLYRGYLGRCIYRVVLGQHLKDLAVTKIQKIIRGVLGRARYARFREERTASSIFVQRIYRGNQGRRLFAMRRAMKYLEDTEKYQNSILGKIDVKKNDLENKYQRMSLVHQKQVVVKIKEEWIRRRNALEKILQPSQNMHDMSWKHINESISENLRARRKLIGVTENVYLSLKELEEDKRRQIELKNELRSAYIKLYEFKYLTKVAVEEKRVLEPAEFWELVEKTKLLSIVKTA